MATRSHGPVDDDDASVGSSKSMSTNGGGTYGFNLDYLGTGIPELIDKFEAYLRSNGCQGLMNSDVLGNLYRLDRGLYNLLLRCARTNCHNCLS